MTKEESGGKFPPLLMNSGMRIKKRKGGKEKKKRGEEKSNRKGKENERKRKIFPAFQWSELDGLRIKVGPHNESYAWVPKSRSFVKLQEVGNFPTWVIYSLKVI